MISNSGHWRIVVGQHWRQLMACCTAVRTKVGSHAPLAFTLPVHLFNTREPSSAAERRQQRHEPRLLIAPPHGQEAPQGTAGPRSDLRLVP